MSRRTGTSLRIQALVKAAEAVARRDAERIEREKAIQAALTDFFQAQGQVERIREEAELASTRFEESMRNAIRILDHLGETRAGIAGLTGLPLVHVREYLGIQVAHDSASGAPTTDRPARRDSRPTASIGGDKVSTDAAVAAEVEH